MENQDIIGNYISTLKLDNHTKGQSIILIMDKFSVSFEDAKKLVHESQAWVGSKASDESLNDAFWDAIIIATEKKD